MHPGLAHIAPTAAYAVIRLVGHCKGRLAVRSYGQPHPLKHLAPHSGATYITSYAVKACLHTPTAAYAVIRLVGHCKGRLAVRSYGQPHPLKHLAPHSGATYITSYAVKACLHTPTAAYAVIRLVGHCKGRMAVRSYGQLHPPKHPAPRSGATSSKKSPCNSYKLQGHIVRMKGLEPPRPETLDPKSNAATNYATCAVFSCCKSRHFFCIHQIFP